jgi:putative tryptophan/tyrosine transport system substrate-binding protein
MHRLSSQCLTSFGNLASSRAKTLRIDWRAYEPHGDLAAQFEAIVKANPDVVCAGGPASIRAAQKATTTIPILGVSDDMVGSGLVNSLAHPGGNTTGVSMLAGDLDGKRQEILIELVPVYAAWGH